MPRKPLLTLWISLLLIVVVLSGCTQTKTQTQPGDPRFVGTWLGNYSWNNLTRTVPQANITFRADGTYQATLPLIIDDGTWSVNGSILTKVSNNSNPDTIKYTFSFSRNGGQLTLTSTTLYEQWNLTKRLTGPY